MMKLLFFFFWLPILSCKLEKKIMSQYESELFNESKKDRIYIFASTKEFKVVVVII